MLPNFLIIGTQKAATSFMRNCLHEHPDIFVAMSEIPFFEDPYFDESGIGEFESLFAAGQDKKAIGLKRPDHLAKPECAARIHRYLPEARLIVLLRDPVDRALAAYHYYIKQGKLPNKSFMKWFAERDREGTDDDELAREIIEYGFYHKHLQRYLRYFPKERILMILYDDIVNQADRVYKEACRFLDVDDQFIPKAINQRPNKGVYNLKRLRVRNYMRIKNRGSLLDKVKAKSVNLVDKLLLSHIWHDGKDRVGDPPRQELYRIYADDIRQLEVLLDRDLSTWKRR